MAAHRVGRRQGRGGGPALQRRPARATVKYNRRSCSGGSTPRAGSTARLQELYRGREEEMPDEVNIDELLELETDEERAQKLQVGGFGGVEGGSHACWGGDTSNPPPPSIIASIPGSSSSSSRAAPTPRYAAGGGEYFGEWEGGEDARWGEHTQRLQPPPPLPPPPLLASPLWLRRLQTGL
uniref:Uncharacterized protein n=1 Tax=Strigops habroptila TaxID=2489341 RepID=A0A672UQ90_STRHB